MHKELFSREEHLLIWLRRKRLSYAEIGRQLGVTRMSALRLCKAQCINATRHEQLCALGIPIELLPERDNEKPVRRARDPKNTVPFGHGTPVTHDKKTTALVPKPAHETLKK